MNCKAMQVFNGGGSFVRCEIQTHQGQVFAKVEIYHETRHTFFMIPAGSLKSGRQAMIFVSRLASDTASKVQQNGLPETGPVSSHVFA